MSKTWSIVQGRIIRIVMAGVGNFWAAWIYCFKFSLVSSFNFPLHDYVYFFSLFANHSITFPMVPPLWFYFRWKVAAHIINQIIPKPFLASLEQKWLWLSKKESPGKGLAGQRIRLMQRNPRQSWILDYSPWIPESLELGFRIPIVSGIPDSYSCILDSTSKIFRAFGIHIP